MKYENTNQKEKLKINKNNTYIVTDFDKTITATSSTDSWDASGNILGECFKKEMNDLYQFYAPIEVDYSLSFEEKEKFMVEWYEKCMNLYYKYGLTKAKLKQSVEESNVIFRKGAKEFLVKAREENIPVIILSAGIGNVIAQFLSVNNCYTDNMYIISNFIEFDENGTMKKFDNSKMIHTLNKTMKGHLPEELGKTLQNRKYKILLGDLCEDEKMVPEEQWEDTLKIGMLNTKIEENLEMYQKKFDIVLTEEDADFSILDEILF